MAVNNDDPGFAASVAERVGARTRDYVAAIAAQQTEFTAAAVVGNGGSRRWVHGVGET